MSPFIALSGIVCAPLAVYTSIIFYCYNAQRKRDAARSRDWPSAASYGDSKTKAKTLKNG
jgi:hypothetical protein